MRYVRRRNRPFIQVLALHQIDILGVVSAKVCFDVLRRRFPGAITVVGVVVGIRVQRIRCYRSVLDMELIIIEARRNHGDLASVNEFIL